MTRRPFIMVLLAVVLGTATSRLAAQTPAQLPPQTMSQSPNATMSLDAALAQAAIGNKTLIAARLHKAVDEAGIDVAAERPNPEFTYEVEREAPHHSLTGAQLIETAGKRGRRIDLARATSGTTAANIDVTALEVEMDVRRAYFTLAAAQRRVEIATDIRAIAQRARDAADARVAAGDAPRLDRLQADLELADTDNDLTAARADIASARATLSGLLGLPASTAIVASDDLTAPAPFGTGGDAAMTAALSANVDLAVLDREIDEQVARRNLAQSMTTPDVTAGGAVVYDAPDEFRVGWRASVTMTVPIFTRHTAAVRVEDAALTELRARRDALVADLSSRIAVASARVAAAREQWDRYTRDILPHSLEVEQMAQESYRAGQTGLAALLQTVQSARALRLRSVQAGLDLQLALADLQRAIGAGHK
jgi:cobalt-zinc-cadmium efflux system outer membrane protein